MYSTLLFLPILQHLRYEVFEQTQTVCPSKHKLFVQSFALEVTDINILDITEFQTHEVVKLLKKSNIDPAFKAKKEIGKAAKKKISSTIQRDSQCSFRQQRTADL